MKLLNRQARPQPDGGGAVTDEGHLINSFVSDLDRLNRDIVLSSVHGWSRVFHRQTAPEVPDVVWDVQIIQQHDDSISALALALGKAVVPVPQRLARTDAFFQGDVGPGDAGRKFQQPAVVSALF